MKPIKEMNSTEITQECIRTLQWARGRAIRVKLEAENEFVHHTGYSGDIAEGVRSSAKLRMASADRHLELLEFMIAVHEVELSIDIADLEAETDDRLIKRIGEWHTTTGTTRDVREANASTLKHLASEVLDVTDRYIDNKDNK